MTPAFRAFDVAAFGPARERRLLPEVDAPGVWEPSRAGLLEWAARLAVQPDQPLPLSSFMRFFRDGNRQEYEELYFGRRRRLEVFALTVLSGAGEGFLPALESVLQAVCEESTWALPAHLAAPEALLTVDLFAAETASALAEILCLAGDRLAPTLVQRVEHEIERRVFAPYFSDRAPWGWETAEHNWAAVCGGGVGIAALWLIDDAVRLKTLLDRLGPTLDSYLAGFSEDGLCLEGMGYWTYGFGYFTAFAELLCQRTRGRLDLLGDPALVPRLRAIAGFPATGRFGNREFVRFSDAHGEFRYPPGIVSRLRTRLGTPSGLDPSLAEDLAYDSCCRWVRHLRDVVWTEPVPAADARPEAGVRWFPSAQWLVARGKGSLGFAAKGGRNDEPHNHNDLGTFELVAGDDVFIDDLGAGRYERDYFREGRYTYFVNSSRSHAVPLIDGREQVAGADRRARAQFDSHPVPSLTLDLESAYDAPALLLLRRTLSLTPDTLLPLTLVDTFVFGDGRHEVTERFVTRLPVSLQGSNAIIEGTNRALRLTVEPVPTAVRVVSEVYAPHEGPDRTAFCIDFVFEAASSLEVRVVFELMP